MNYCQNYFNKKLNVPAFSSEEQDGKLDNPFLPIPCLDSYQNCRKETRDIDYVKIEAPWLHLFPGKHRNFLI